MASRYQTALLDQLDGPARRRGGTAQVETPGLQAPAVSGGIPAGGIAAPATEDQMADILSQAPSAPAAGPPDFQAIFMNAMRGKPYGQAGYAAAEGELGKHGIQLQKNSAGQYRGRIKLPTGDIVDTALNEGNDNAFLSGGQGTGAYGFLNRGQEGLDPGGWSFGGGGGGTLAMPQMTPHTGLEGLYTGNGQDQITQGVEQYSQPSKYLEALLAQLGAT